MKVNVLLIGAAMAAMAGGAGAAEPEPNAVFGVLSDIHLVPADVRSVERFKKTLRYLDSRKVDGVVICGDLTPCATTLW